MELFLALRRIQELEAEVCRLTKEKEHAESSARMLRANNKDLLKEAKVTYPPNVLPIEYCVQDEMDFGLDDRQFEEYLITRQTERFYASFGRYLADDGYLTLRRDDEVNYRTRKKVLILTGQINVCKTTPQQFRF